MIKSTYPENPLSQRLLGKGRFAHQTRLALQRMGKPALALGLLLLTGGACHADVHGLIGNGGGTVDTAGAQAIAQSGGKVARLGSDRSTAFWNGTAATPQNFDGQVKAAHQNNLRALINLVQYTKFEPNVPIGGYDKWYKIGRAFAQRFQPNSAWLVSQGINNWGVEYYDIHNELWNTGFYSPKLTPQQIYDTSKGYADGVHSVNANLKVAVAGWVPGAEQSSDSQDPMIRPLVPLYNNGTLASFGYHFYWWGWEPVNGTYERSAQTFVDAVKRSYGLNDSVHFSITEWNVNKLDPNNASDFASKFLTGLWDRTGTVNGANQPNCDFALVYTVIGTPTTDDKFALASSLNPWTPADDRGRIYQTVCSLTSGMNWVSLDPKAKGEYVLNGNNKKLWVWQNRNGWTNHPSTSYTVSGIPSGATQLKVYGYNGLRSTITLTGQSSYTVTNLPQGETLMFLVNAASTTTTGANLVTNPGFEATGATQTPTGWSEWSDTNSESASFTEPYGGAHGGTYHGTHWVSASPYRVFTYQFKTGLANGLYMLRAWVKNGGGQKVAEMEAKDHGDNGSQQNVALPVTSTWTQISIDNINVTNGQRTIGFWSDANAGNWIHFDDVEFFKK